MNIELLIEILYILIPLTMIGIGLHLFKNRNVFSGGDGQ